MRRRSRRCLRGTKSANRKLSVEDLKRIVAGADVFSRQSDGTTIAGAIFEAWNLPALREHRPREWLGGDFATVRRCRGRDTSDTFHSSAMRSSSGNFARLNARSE